MKLPALAVKGGVAIVANGRFYVSMENGELLCMLGSVPAITKEKEP